MNFMSKLLQLKWFFFLLVLIFFAFYEKLQLPLSASKVEFIFLYISNPYIFLYFILPFLTLILQYELSINFKTVQLIRYRDYMYWSLSIMKKVIINIFVVLFLQLLVGVVVSAPYTNSFVWTNSENLLESIRYSPLILLVLQMIHQTLFLSITLYLQVVILIISKRQSFSISSAILISLMYIVSFKSFSNIEFLRVQSYLISYRAVETFHDFYTAPLLMLCVLGTLVGILYCYDRKLISRRLLKQHVPYIIYIIFCFLGLFSSSVNVGESIGTFWELLFNKFYGASQMGMKFINYLYTTIVYLGFVYLCQLYLTTIISSRLYFILIRQNSMNHVFYTGLKKLSITIFILLMTIFGSLALLAIMLNYSFEYVITYVPKIPVSYFLYQFFINGFLQLIFYVLIVFIVSWIYKDVAKSLLVLGIFMVLLLPKFNPWLLLPIGLNNLSYVTADFLQLFKLTLILIIWIVGIYYFVVRRYIFKNIDL